jgi:hypothetical protein
MKWKSVRAGSRFSSKNPDSNPIELFEPGQ